MPERIHDAVGAALAGGGQQFVEVGVAETPHGLAVEVQTADDRADRPAPLQQAVHVLVAVPGASMIWVRGSSAGGNSIGGNSSTSVTVSSCARLPSQSRCWWQVFSTEEEDRFCNRCRRSATSRASRGGYPDRPGAGAGPVPADDLGPRVPGESGRERLRGAVGQHVHDPAGPDVGQHGAIGAALAEGELVHPQHPRGTVRHRWPRQQPEQPRPARGQPQASAQPDGRTAAAIDRDRPRSTVASPTARCWNGGTARTDLARARQTLCGNNSFGRRSTGAPAAAHDPARSQRPLIQGALARAVHASRLLPAVRATARTSRRHRLPHQDVGGVAHPLHPHIEPGRQHILNRFARHGRKHPAETIHRSRR